MDQNRIKMPQIIAVINKYDSFVCTDDVGLPGSVLGGGFFLVASAVSIAVGFDI